MRRVNDMSVGAWNKLPHYSVVGEPNSFYVWVNIDNTNHDSASNWIKGSYAFENYNKLIKLFNKDKNGFVKLVEQLHRDNFKVR